MALFAALTSRHAAILKLEGPCIHTGSIRIIELDAGVALAIGVGGALRRKTGSRGGSHVQAIATYSARIGVSRPITARKTDSFTALLFQTDKVALLSLFGITGVELLSAGL